MNFLGLRLQLLFQIKKDQIDFQHVIKTATQLTGWTCYSSYPTAWLVKIATAAGGIMKDLVLSADKCGGYTEMQKQLITVRHIKALPA